MEPVSRKERRRAERQARKERRQKERDKLRKSGQLQKLLFYLAGALLFVGLGYWAYGYWASGAPGQFVPSLGNQHVSPASIGSILYNSDPPTSGPHLSALARWGVHENPIPKELQVHNLEDGGVLVQYNCQPAEAECKELIEKLARIVRRYERAILAPYPGMSHRIALTAWTRIDKFDEFYEQRIVRFIDAYVNIDHHPRR